MALIFSSGGGRLGNQILNLIHLMAIVFEYNIESLQNIDNSLISNDGNIIFKVNKRKLIGRLIKII